LTTGTLETVLSAKPRLLLALAT